MNTRRCELRLLCENHGQAKLMDNTSSLSCCIIKSVLMKLILTLCFLLFSAGCGDRVDKLSSKLTHHDPNIRSDAVKELAKIGNRRAIEPLINTLRDQDRQVRLDAAQALNVLGWKPKNNAENAYYFAARRYWPGCVEIGTAAIEPLVIALEEETAISNENNEISDDLPNIAEALCKIGDPDAIEPLFAMLKNENPNIRYIAIENLGKARNLHTIEPLTAALMDKEADVRNAAAYALGELGDPRAIEPLIVALKDKNVYVHGSVARALGKIGDRRAIEPLESAGKSAALGASAIDPLIAALGDKSSGVQDIAIQSLREIGAPAVKPLIEALKDLNVRSGAAKALGEIKDVRAIDPLIAVLGDEDNAVEALGKIGAPAVEPLIAALRDEDWYVRENAAEALGETKDARAVKPLIEALKDLNIRSRAAEALGEIKDVRAIDPLIAALGDEEQYFRNNVAGALGKIGAPAVAPLMAALRGHVRENAVGALGKIGAPAVAPLIAALKDEDTNVRRNAADALGEVNDVRAVEPLIEALKDPNVRRNAADALGEIKDVRAIDPLIAALGDEERYFRNDAAGALGKIGAPAVGPLIAALKSQYYHVRMGAAMALGEIGDSRATKVLVAALENRDLEIIAGAHSFFIEWGWGKLDTKDILIEALNKHGTANIDIALDFLNCGDLRLSQAAKEWAEKHGYREIEVILRDF